MLHTNDIAPCRGFLGPYNIFARTGLVFGCHQNSGPPFTLDFRARFGQHVATGIGRPDVEIAVPVLPVQGKPDYPFETTTLGLGLGAATFKGEG